MIPGRVQRLTAHPGLPVPHMGWNQLSLRRESPLTAGIADGDYVYFVHSYSVAARRRRRSRPAITAASSRLSCSSGNFFGDAVPPGALRRRRPATACEFPEPARMELIPAIDLRGGRCVRLLQGRFDAETRYSSEPAQLLERYRSLGAATVHVVDLDGAREGCRRTGT